MNKLLILLVQSEAERRLEELKKHREDTRGNQEEQDWVNREAESVMGLLTACSSYLEIL